MHNLYISSLIFSFFVIYIVSFPLEPTPDMLVGPNCHLCEVILNNVRYEYHNNFTGVTEAQLKKSLYAQCDYYLNGFSDQECHVKVDQDAGDILHQLQDGTSSYRICQKEEFCQ